MVEETVEHMEDSAVEEQSDEYVRIPCRRICKGERVTENHCDYIRSWKCGIRVRNTDNRNDRQVLDSSHQDIQSDYMIRELCIETIYNVQHNILQLIYRLHSYIE